MKPLRLAFTFLALLAGVAMVAISLMAVSQAYSHESSGISTRRLYIGQTILPDNIAYPALMVVDKVRLELSPPAERIDLQVEYAQRRFGHAQKLLSKGETALALSTLTKSHKYLFNAAEEALQQPATSITIKEKVAQNLEEQCAQLAQLHEANPDLDGSVVNQLTEQSKVLAERLQDR